MAQHLKTPDLVDRMHLVSRAAAILGVGAAYTLTLPVSQLIHRRFQREDLLKRRHRMIEWARLSARTLCAIQLDVQGREHLPSPTRGHMFVSNHQSYMDILVLMDALDTVAFLSKGLVRHFPVLGRAAYCGGTVFLERRRKDDRRRALEETMRMCQQSTAVVVFPEGTRSSDGNLRTRIYSGSMQEAWRRGLRVIPVALDGTCDVVPKTMDRLHLGQPVAVRIGRPLDPADHEKPTHFVDACWGRVAELFASARKARRNQPQSFEPRH
jgi:1-acyl-sn-glycerol-3-phosphate acyltransferase